MNEETKERRELSGASCYRDFTVKRAPVTYTNETGLHIADGIHFHWKQWQRPLSGFAFTMDEAKEKMDFYYR